MTTEIVEEDRPEIVRWNNQVKWNDLGPALQWAFVNDFNGPDDDLPGMPMIRHENKCLDARISHEVPFSLTIVTLHGVRHLVLAPQYAGPSVVERDYREHLVASLLPLILPLDTLCYYDRHEEEAPDA